MLVRPPVPNFVYCFYCFSVARARLVAWLVCFLSDWFTVFFYLFFSLKSVPESNFGKTAKPSAATTALALPLSHTTQYIDISVALTIPIRFSGVVYLFLLFDNKFYLFFRPYRCVSFTSHAFIFTDCTFYLFFFSHRVRIWRFPCFYWCSFINLHFAASDIIINRCVFIFAPLFILTTIVALG